MSALNIISQSVAYSDPLSASAPLRKAFDWSRSFQNISVSNPRSEAYGVAGSQTLTVFDLSESTSIDGTTAFDVSLNPVSADTYRFTVVSGTAPAFRTSRSISVVTHPVTVVVNTNVTATFSVGTGGAFTGVVAGDIIFIPGLSTGDSAGAFNTLNEGFWVVNGVLSSTSLNLVRPTGVTFSAYGEVVIPAAGEFLAFSSAGVQVGDSVQITGSFAPATQNTFIISVVTPSWFEVVSAIALSLETGITPDTDMEFYSAAKRWIRIESDQAVVVKLNNDTGTFNQIAPIAAGDSAFVGWFELWGPVFKLVLINKSVLTANISIFSCE